jgi:hypothetical protein
MDSIQVWLDKANFLSNEKPTAGVAAQGNIYPGLKFNGTRVKADNFAA